MFLVLTNNSIYTPRDLRARLHRTGLDIPEQSLWTSAPATAQFLSTQRPNGSAFVIGEAGLTTALHEVGYVLTDRDPDYVVLGETRTYSHRDHQGHPADRGRREVHRHQPRPDRAERGRAATRHRVGRRPDRTGDREAALLRRQTEPTHDAFRDAYARCTFRTHRDDRRPDGYRLHAGIEAGLRSILVLTGISSADSAERYPFRPTLVIDSVADLIGRTTDPFR